MRHTCMVHLDPEDGFRLEWDGDRPVLLVESVRGVPFRLFFRDSLQLAVLEGAIRKGRRERPEPEPDGSADKFDIVPAEAATASEDDLPSGWARDPVNGRLYGPNGLIVYRVPDTNRRGYAGRYGLVGPFLSARFFATEAEAISSAESLIRSGSVGPVSGEFAAWGGTVTEATGRANCPGLVP